MKIAAIIVALGVVVLVAFVSFNKIETKAIALISTAKVVEVGDYWTTLELKVDDVGETFEMRVMKAKKEGGYFVITKNQSNPLATWLFFQQKMGDGVGDTKIHLVRSDKVAKIFREIL
jgi:hypothetical protein